MRRRLKKHPGELREREVRGFSSPCLLTATSCASGHVGRSWWSGTLLGVLLMAVAASACTIPIPIGLTLSDPMSVEEYTAVCGEASAASGDDATIAEISEVLDENIRRMESVTPPREVAELHNVMLDYQRALKAALQTLLPQLDALKDVANSLDSDVRALLAEAGCLSEENASGFEAGSLPNQALASPSHATYAVEGSTTVVSWDAVDGADHYNIYHDDFHDSSCRVRSGGASFCEELAANITDTAYTHTDPDDDANYYWVTACNRHGCSQVDSENAAGPIEPVPSSPTNLAYAVEGSTTVGPIEPVPSSPTNLAYAVEGSTTVVSWDAVDGADHYNIYHDDFFDSSCRVRSGGASFCEELAANITDTAYTHTDPEGDSDYYWVTACNRGGCSQVDSENPAGPIEPVPSSPANLAYASEGSTTVVSWDAVDGVDHYNIYHDDFFDSSCRVRSGGASFCEELAANITDTAYTHTDPEGDSNYYWVTACNRGGCSQVDSENPATLREDR